MRLIARLLVVLTVLATSSGVVRGQQQEAEAFVNASWTEAQSLARVLVARDIQASLNFLAEALRPIAQGNRLSALLEARKQVEDALRRASSANLADLAASEAHLDRAMQLYRDATSTRYRLSWYSVEPLTAAAAIPGILDRAHEDLRNRCSQGASIPAEDFLTAPRPALPGFRIGFAGRFWVKGGPGTPGEPVGATKDNVTDTRITTANTDADDGREFWYGAGYAAGMGICMAAGVATGGATAAAAQWCGAAGAFLVSIYYAIVDLLDHNREVEAFAASEAYRLNNRAVAKDVSALYRQYCGYAVESLGIIASVTKMTPAEQQAFVAATEEKAFVEEIKRLNDRQQKEHEARCRVSLADAMVQNSCPAIGTPLAATVYAPDPTCRPKDEAGVSFECPVVVTKQDTLCRIGSDGSLIRLPVETSVDGGLIVLDNKSQEEAKPVCTVPRVSGKVRHYRGPRISKSLVKRTREARFGIS